MPVQEDLFATFSLHSREEDLYKAGPYQQVLLDKDSQRVNTAGEEKEVRLPATSSKLTTCPCSPRTYSKLQRLHGPLLSLLLRHALEGWPSTV